VVYGLLAHGPNGPNYPHSNKFKIGGCQIGAVEIAKVLYCQECRSADPDWDPKQAQLSWNPSPEQIKVEHFEKRCNAAGISLAGVNVETNGLYYISFYDPNLKELSILSDLPVGGLDIRSTSVTDLSPIAGKPIQYLDISHTAVTDLSPLTGMKIERLSIQDSKVTDLSPLRSVTVSNLYLCNSLVTDLSPLQGMPLDELYLEWTKVTDLSPLTNCPIRYMSIIGTQVSNMMPLARMPIKALFLQDSAVTDLSPLSGCPLESLVYSESTVTNGLKAIREISTLEAINNIDAAEFWRNHDLAGEERVEALGAELDIIQSESERTTKDRD